MARWLGIACFLLLDGVALGQVPLQEPTPPAYIPAPPTPVYLYADDNQYIPPAPLAPELEAMLLNQPPVMPMQPGVTMPPADFETPLTTVVYSVADLVVGQSSGADPNQALMAMLMQQSEELAMAMQTAAVSASAGQAPTDPALTELATTIESTFADEFEEQGSITPHRGTHSLIIRQTEEVHAQIGDLLDQLRHVNDTEIKVSIELSELNDATQAFALTHNGQVLDEAQLAEFREISQVDQTELMKFAVTTRNGESANLPAFGLPGTMTAVASEDRNEVRLLLDMLWGMEMGISQHNSYRVPNGGSVLTVFMVDGCGVVVLLSAEIVASEEAEELVFATGECAEWQSRMLKLNNCPAEDAANGLNLFLDAQSEIGQLDPERNGALLERQAVIVSDPVTNCVLIQASPLLFNELLDLAAQLDAPPVQVMAQAMLVECESLPEDFFGWALDRFEGAIHQDSQSSERLALCLEPGEADDLVRELAAEGSNVRVHSRPQVTTLNGVVAQIQIGQIVPVVNGISFANGETIPIVEQRHTGILLNVVPTLTECGCIELQLDVSNSHINGEVVLCEAAGETITSPIVDCTTASTTFTVPQGSTLVWPVPAICGDEPSGRTLLLILTPRELE